MSEQEVKRLIEGCIPALLKALEKSERNRSYASKHTGIARSKMSRLIRGLQEPSLEDAVAIERLVKKLISPALAS